MNHAFILPTSTDIKSLEDSDLGSCLPWNLKLDPTPPFQQLFPSLVTEL